MKLTISAEELRKRSLMIATPAYGGNCTTSYCVSMCKLMTRLAGSYGMSPSFLFPNNQSLITSARNYCATEFLKTNITHLLFIDADEEFEPEVVLSLLALQSDDSPYDVIGAPVARKDMDWTSIASAARAGVPDDQLRYFTNTKEANYAALTPEPYAFDKPVEIKALGTEFMLIHRRVFERLETRHPEWRCTLHGDRAVTFFETGIDEETGIYFGEDWTFCRRVRDAGMRVWLCPWLCVGHIGRFKFQESLKHRMEAARCLGSEKITVREQA